MNFLELVKARYSARLYAERTIEPEKLNYVLECVRLSPSAKNQQPWQLFVITDPHQLKAIQACYALDWITSAPCIIVMCGNHNTAWHRASDNKDHTDIDVAIATEHLCLAAAEQGLGTCWVCNFDAMRCAELLKLPPHIEPIALIPIGYATDTPRKKKRRTVPEITEQNPYAQAQ